MLDFMLLIGNCSLSLFLEVVKYKRKISNKSMFTDNRFTLISTRLVFRLIRSNKKLMVMLPFSILSIFTTSVKDLVGIPVRFANSY